MDVCRIRLNGESVQKISPSLRGKIIGTVMGTVQQRKGPSWVQVQSWLDGCSDEDLELEVRRAEEYCTTSGIVDAVHVPDTLTAVALSEPIASVTAIPDAIPPVMMLIGASGGQANSDLNNSAGKSDGDGDADADGEEIDEDGR